MRLTDSDTYTGLGMRLRKSDPTGSYWYFADGVAPASDVLSDGYATFTPGISEVNSLGSRFYLPDAQGNSRGLLDSYQGNTDGYNWDGFGNSMSRNGSNPTAFAWNEASGYQSDNDSGLKLLGHRYYDTRIGRFITQDPAGDGDNWYSYAGNDPMNGTDPSGLSPDPNPSGMWGINGGAMTDSSAVYSLVGGGGPWGGADGRYMWHMTGATTIGDVTTLHGYTYWVPDEPGLFDGVGGAFGVGFSAVGSAASFGLWNGGAARRDPSFGVSRGLADVGVAAGTAALGAIAAVGRGTEEAVTLYRAVSTAERDDILASGTFRAGGNSSVFGKWFAESAEDANTWGMKMYKGDPYHVVQAKVPQSIAAKMMRVGPKYDNIGWARFAEAEHLAHMTP